jgi:hypothetical protein
MQFFLPLLTILFIGLKLTGYIAWLKLTGYIAWSWLWVLSPFWLGFTIAFIIIMGIHFFTKAYTQT